MSVSDPYVLVARRVDPDATFTRRVSLRGGVSARVDALELVRADGTPHRVVVRQHGAAEWKPLAADVTTTELALLRALHAAGMQVPEPLFADASREILPAPYLVMSFVDGAADVGAAELPRALERMGRYLARLHALDVHALALPSLPGREDPVAGALEYLPLAPEHDALRAVLEAHGPLVPKNPPALLHGDFWPGNVLWRGGEIAAVLDWEDAAIGDPLADLAGARVELLWRHGEAAMDALTASYLAAARVDTTQLAYWELFVVLAGTAFMSEWGLAPDVEARMRERSAWVVARAGGAALGSRALAPP